MGKARKTSANGAKRGVQSGGRRRSIATAAVGADADQALSVGRSMEPHAVDPGVGPGRLAAGGQAGAGKNYRCLRLKAEAALELLVTAKGVPPNVRAAAVRTALELVGAIGARSKDQRDQEDADGALDPESLSVADIDREIGKLGRV